MAPRFVDNHGAVTQTCPLNPNGSSDGITSVATTDVRFTVLMPHPECMFRATTMS
ncbi:MULTISPECIES: phosphoribosylformylglycinamidine synthase subunit PurQ [unclassified Cupriavidus]|uniref:phosphoribosylformylglycinamidine synthase subunit PurQ n=1 Tax=unclassified Cupriavidus TaxID=2640874 RepID=UPI003F9075E1